MKSSACDAERSSTGPRLTSVVGILRMSLAPALIVASDARRAPGPGCTQVPDQRLDRLAGIAASERVVPTTVEYVDIAGLVKGASKGEGLGNKFLANIRECDSIVQARARPVVPASTSRGVVELVANVGGCGRITSACLQVVRCFEDANVVHVSGKVSSGPGAPVDVQACLLERPPDATARAMLARRWTLLRTRTSSILSLRWQTLGR